MRHYLSYSLLYNQSDGEKSVNLIWMKLYHEIASFDLPNFLRFFYYKRELWEVFMLKKIFITGGIALAAYVLNSMRKEFDKNVSDYNDLVDKYNDLVQSKNGNHYPDSKERYKKETQVMPDGSQITVVHDSVTGFSVLSN